MEDLGIVGRIVLKWIFKNRLEDVVWSDVAQVRDKLRALVFTVINLRVK